MVVVLNVRFVGNGLGYVIILVLKQRYLGSNSAIINVDQKYSKDFVLEVLGENKIGYLYKIRHQWTSATKRFTGNFVKCQLHETSIRSSF